MSANLESLYAIQFSNGLVKVGRAIAPEKRIRQHADRLSVAGITIIDRHHEPAAGSIAFAESSLIARCKSAATRKSNHEWFEGLDFSDVRTWLSHCASEAGTAVFAPMEKLRAFMNSLSLLDQSAFCGRCGTTPRYLRKAISIRQKRLGEKLCLSIEHESDGAVTRKDLRPDDWHEIWPDLWPLTRPSIALAVTPAAA